MTDDENRESRTAPDDLKSRLFGEREEPPTDFNAMRADLKKLEQELQEEVDSLTRPNGLRIIGLRRDASRPFDMFSGFEERYSVKVEMNYDDSDRKIKLSATMQTD